MEKPLSKKYQNVKYYLKKKKNKRQICESFDDFKKLQVNAIVKIKLNINYSIKAKQIYYKNNLLKNKNNSSKNKKHQNSKSRSDLCTGLLYNSTILFKIVPEYSLNMKH